MCIHICNVYYINVCIYIYVCVMLHKSYFDSVMNFESAGVPYFGVKARQSSHEGGKQRPRTTPRTRMQRSQWRIPGSKK